MKDGDKSSVHSGGPSGKAVRIAQVGLFILALVYGIYAAKPVLLPLLLALLLTMVLKPIHRRLVQHSRIPAPAAGGLVVIAFLALLFFAGSRLADPASEWLETMDMRAAEERLKEVFAPIQEVQRDLEDVVNKVDNITETTPAPDEDEDADEDLEPGEDRDNDSAGGNEVKVTISAPEATAEQSEDGSSVDATPPVEVEISERPVNAMFSYLQDFGVHAIATLLLILFFLGYGEAMHDRLAEDNAMAALMKRVGRDVSAYLFTITAINSGLGICVAGAMWALGMPNPVLWGVLAALLNYIPYAGAVVGAVVVFFVSVVSLENTTLYFVVPAVYFALTAIEGNVVTPTVIGKRFTLNPIVIVLWFMGWGAIWGVPGMLIATPTLMACKIVCANADGLRRMDRIISLK